MAKVKGLLVQARRHRGIVLTPDGRFVKGWLLGQRATLGQEVECSVLSVTSAGPVLAAACFLLILLFGFYRFSVQPAAAYVALDINPSLELTVNLAGKVTDSKGMNNDGRTLLAEQPVKGLPIYQAIGALVNQAIKHHYIATNKENVVLATVTRIKQVEIDDNQLRQMINNSLTAQKMPGQVLVEESTPADREAAQKEGLSAGRYLLQQKAREHGVNLPAQELKGKGMGELLQHNVPAAKNQGIVKVPQNSVNDLNPGERDQDKKNSAPDESPKNVKGPDRLKQPAKFERGKKSHEKDN